MNKDNMKENHVKEEAIETLKHREHSLLHKIDGMSWKQLLVIQQSIVLGIFIVFFMLFFIFFGWAFFHAY